MADALTIILDQTASAAMPIPDFSENLLECWLDRRLAFLDTSESAAKHDGKTGIIHY